MNPTALCPVICAFYVRLMFTKSKPIFLINQASLREITLTLLISGIETLSSINVADIVVTQNATTMDRNLSICHHFSKRG